MSQTARDSAGINKESDAVDAVRDAVASVRQSFQDPSSSGPDVKRTISPWRHSAGFEERIAGPFDWRVDCIVVISALLSAIHVLTLALGLGAVFIRGRALARPLDEAGWQRLLAADNLWGVAAGLWIASGLGRVFFGGKEPGFYWHNGLFWVKLALFGVVFALEVAPMMTFIRVRSARRHGTALPQFPIGTYRRINGAEVVLVVVIAFVAAFMARGAWLF